MQKFPGVTIDDVKAWIKRDLNGCYRDSNMSDDYVRDIYEGTDPETFDIHYRFAFYTATNEYRIHARIEGSYDDTCSYLGCSVIPRQNLAGVDNRRSSELADGHLTEQTWSRILAAIVSNELMQLAVGTNPEKTKFVSGSQSSLTYNGTVTECVLNTPVSLGLSPTKPQPEWEKTKASLMNGLEPMKLADLRESVEKSTQKDNLNGYEIVPITTESTWAKPGASFEAPVGFYTRYGYVFCNNDGTCVLETPEMEQDRIIAGNITR